MSQLEVSIVPLGKIHRPALKDFDCGVESLNVYLKRFAERHSLRDHLSRTHLALATGAEGAVRVAGYHSVSTSSLAHDAISEHPDLGKLPRFPVPGILLARLAVATQARGQGLGRRLFAHALGLGLEASASVAARVFVTDALNEQAVSFYDSMGMMSLGEEDASFPRRMILDLYHVESRRR